MKPHIREICDWLRSLGAARLSVEEGGRHVHVVFTFDGAVRFYPLSRGSNISRRAIENAKRDLRRLLGLSKTRKTTGVRRRRRQRAAVSLPRCPTLTVLPDDRERLAGWPGLLHYRAEQAWRNLWRSAMQRVGGRSRL